MERRKNILPAPFTAGLRRNIKKNIRILSCWFPRTEGLGNCIIRRKRGLL